jgi:lysophospholipase L1-like esterase
VRLKNLLRRCATYHYVVEVKLKAFYERHRSRFIPVDPRTDPLFKDQQQNDPHAVFEKSIHDLCALAQTNGVRPVLLFLPTEDELTATNAPALLEVKQRVAQQLTVPLVDFRRVAAGGGNGLYLEGDPVHFNRLGNDLIAREILDRLMPLVTP